MILEEYCKSLQELIDKHENIYTRIAPTFIWLYTMSSKPVGAIEVMPFGGSKGLSFIDKENGVMTGCCVPVTFPLNTVKEEKIKEVFKKEIISINGGSRFGFLEIYLED